MIGAGGFQRPVAGHQPRARQQGREFLVELRHQIALLDADRCRAVALRFEHVRQCADRRAFELDIRLDPSGVACLLDGAHLVAGAQQKIAAAGGKPGNRQPLADIVLQAEQCAGQIENILHAEGEQDVDPVPSHLRAQPRIVSDVCHRAARQMTNISSLSNASESSTGPWSVMAIRSSMCSPFSPTQRTRVSTVDTMPAS